MNYKLGDKVKIRATRDYQDRLKIGNMYYGVIVAGYMGLSISAKCDKHITFETSLSSCTDKSWFEIMATKLNKNVKIL